MSFVPKEEVVFSPTSSFPLTHGEGPGLGDLCSNPAGQAAPN